MHGKGIVWPILPAALRNTAGFTYLALLFAVSIMGVMLAGGAVIWSTAQQREKERELLFTGNEFRRAIGTYYDNTPGAVKRYPATFEDLLEDNRFVARVRHLRRIYTDPMTSSADWGVVRAADGGIMGVYSQAAEAPIKRSQFAQRDADFEGAIHYTEWRFVYEPQNVLVPPATVK